MTTAKQAIDPQAADQQRVDQQRADHQVVIAGGGPTGLMLAAELRLAGVDVVIVERRADQHVDGSRAGGLYPRTLEVLDQRGVAARFVEAGTTTPMLGFGGTTLAITDLPTRHNYVLALWQSAFEPILAEWVAELGVPTMRSRDVVGCAANGAAVTVELSDGTSLRADYVVGCDGGRSVIRKSAGIGFPGVEASTSWLIAEAEMDDPELGMRHDEYGTHGLGRLGDDGPIRVVITEREVARGEPELDDLREALVTVFGSDQGLRSATWVSRFTDMTRQADEYRRGRVLLAGDAAHVHPPHGGQGLNTGVQDAVNLGWKLAQVIRGTSTDALLDTYHSERHPVGALVLHNTMAQVAVNTPGARHQALRETLAELLAFDEPRRRTASMQAGLDIRYGSDAGHPLTGRRMPDLDLRTSAGSTRTYRLLERARPVLLELDGARRTKVDGWANRVDVHAVTCDATCELPVIGTVELPDAVLIRPDGHVAWAGSPSDPGLHEALATWFGPPVTSAGTIREPNQG